MTTEPPEVPLTPSFQRLLAELEAAAGDEERYAAIIKAATAEDRLTFLAWSRRRVWLESEVMGEEESIREIDRRLAKLDDDLDAAATLGWGPEAFDKLAASGVAPGAFAEFRSLDVETRALVLRLLDSPGQADFDELAALPHGRALAQWLLTLPAYVNAPDDDDPFDDE